MTFKRNPGITRNPHAIVHVQCWCLPSKWTTNLKKSPIKSFVSSFHGELPKNICIPTDECIKLHITQLTGCNQICFISNGVFFKVVPHWVQNQFILPFFLRIKIKIKIKSKSLLLMGDYYRDMSICECGDWPKIKPRFKKLEKSPQPLFKNSSFQDVGVHQQDGFRCYF